MRDLQRRLFRSVFCSVALLSQEPNRHDVGSVAGFSHVLRFVHEEHLELRRTDLCSWVRANFLLQMVQSLDCSRHLALHSWLHVAGSRCSPRGVFSVAESGRNTSKRLTPMKPATTATGAMMPIVMSTRILFPLRPSTWYRKCVLARNDCVARFECSRISLRVASRAYFQFVQPHDYQFDTITRI